jgi:DnaJ-class molecular chaperone
MTNTDLYAKETCRSCGGDGQVKTGESPGSCDGPQYGPCGACGGTGQEFVPVKIVVSIQNR